MIDILRIKQKAIVVIDSDRKKKRDTHINKTKTRIRKECETNGSVCWITHGREIENYLPREVVESAFAEEITFVPTGRFEKFEKTLERSLLKAHKKNVHYEKNKVKYAREFITYFEVEQITPELRKQMEQIIKKIEIWNGIMGQSNDTSY